METEVLTSLDQLKPLPKTYSEIVKKLLEMKNPRIGEIDYERAINSIGTVMETVYAVMGFRDVMEDHHGAKVLQFIQFHTREFHPVEIEVAFDLVAKGVIKVDLQKGFNLRYIYATLDGYTKYRKGIAQPKAIEEKPKKEASLTPEAYRKIHEDAAKTIDEFFKKYCADEKIIESDYRTLTSFHYLIKRGFIVKNILRYPAYREKAAEVLKRTKRSKTGISLAFTEEDIDQLIPDLVITDLFAKWKNEKADPHKMLIESLK